MLAALLLAFSPSSDAVDAMLGTAPSHEALPQQAAWVEQEGNAEVVGKTHDLEPKAPPISASEGRIQTQKAIAAPVLVSLSSATTVNPEWVSGTGPVGNEIRVYVNGELMQLSNVLPDGTFSTRIPLYDGSNAVHATAWDGVEESPASNTMNTTYTNTLPRNQSGTITVDTVWTPSGGIYSLTGNLVIAAGVELRLMPGVEVRSAGSFQLSTNGLLLAHGTSSLPIVFRSGLASPAKGSWKGVQTSSTGYVDLEHVLIEHAVSGLRFDGGTGYVRRSTMMTNTNGVYVGAGSSPLFESGFVITGNTEGVWIQGDSNQANNPLPRLVGGSIHTNSSRNVFTSSFGNGPAVVIDATGNWWGTVDVGAIAGKIYDNSDSVALPTVDFSGYVDAPGGSPVFAGGSLAGPVTADRTIAAGDYQLLGNMRISPGATLTFLPGTTVRAPVGTFSIDVSGTLVAHGTAAEPIHFRSAKAIPVKGDWNGINVLSTGYVDFDYVEVQHGVNGIKFTGGEGLIRHTKLSTNGNGAYIAENSGPQFEAGFEVTNNTNGVFIKGNNVAASNPLPSLIGGSIYANSNKNLSTETFGNGAAVTINATGNWWGIVDVAAIAAKIVDNSDNIALPTVDFSGYVDAPGGSPVFAGGSLAGPVTADRTIAAGDYQLLGNMRVSPGATLTFLPGTTVRAPVGAFSLDVSGTLVAHGTPAEPIHFLSGKAIPVKGDWNGINVLTTGYVDLDYVEVQHAVNGLNFTGGEGAIRHTTLSTNTKGTSIGANSSPQFESGFVITGNTDGVWIQGNSNEANNPLPRLVGGSIHTNSSRNIHTNSFGNGPEVTIDATGNWWGTVDVGAIAGTINDNSDNIALPTVDFSGYVDAPDGSPVFAGGSLVGPVTADRTIAAGDYQLLGNMRVSPGATLTFLPGTTVRAPVGAFSIDVSGTLLVHGTIADPIRFRSAKVNPAQGDWIGINVLATGYVDFDYVEVQHAVNGLKFTGGDGLIRHTKLSTNGNGTYIAANSSPQFEAGFEITNNTNGVWIQGNNVAASNPVPSLVGGSIYANSNRNLHTQSFGNGATVTINATRNWWGSVDPTSIRATIYDRLDNAILPRVDFLDYLSLLDGEPHLIAYDFVFESRVADLQQPSSTRTTFVLNTDSDATFDVFHESDPQTPAASIAQGVLPAGPHIFEWDGRDTTGARVQDGTYRIVPTLYKNGRTWSSDPPIPSGAGSGSGVIQARFNAYRNEFWKTQFQSAGPANIDMQVTPAGGTTFTPVVNQFVEAGSTWVYWDGRDPQGHIVEGSIGVYFPTPRLLRPWYVVVKNGALSISGVGLAPSIEVKADPYLVTHSYEQLTHLAFRISADSIVTVKLLPPGIVDPASSSAIVLLTPQMLLARDANGAPIDHVIEWRGHETNDQNRMRTALDGPHTFTIEATSSQTQSAALYRGVLQLYQ